MSCCWRRWKSAWVRDVYTLSMSSLLMRKVRPVSRPISQGGRIQTCQLRSRRKQRMFWSLWMGSIRRPADCCTPTKNHRISLVAYFSVACQNAPLSQRVDQVWVGHADQKFIAYPVGREAELEGTSLVDWIAILRVRDKDDPGLTPPQAYWGKVAPKERFASQFQSWTFGFLSIPELIEDTKEVTEFPMCDRMPVDRWSFGRLTLLGDAAHPLYPSRLPF